MTVTLGKARRLASGLLRNAGLTEGNAYVTARAITIADAWGLGSHGLLRLPFYLDRLAAGGYRPDAELTVRQDTGPLLVLDGAGGLGHWQVHHACKVAVERVQAHAIALVAVGNSGHCGALGVYAGDLARAGCVGLVFSNGPAVMPAWSGDRALLSTSPLAGGFPGQPAPAIVDLALSTVARGKIAAYARANQALPAEWALDADGRAITDPNAALQGMLAPIGGAKGFALAFLVEALTAGLIGPALSSDQPDFYDSKSIAMPQGIAHLVLAVDPHRTDAGGDPMGPARRLGELRARVEASGGRVPGSRRFLPDGLADEIVLDVDPQVLRELIERSDGAASADELTPA